MAVEASWQTHRKLSQVSCPQVAGRLSLIRPIQRSCCSTIRMLTNGRLAPEADPNGCNRAVILIGELSRALPGWASHA